MIKTLRNLGVVLAATVSLNSHAQLKLPAIFSDHMVLQRDHKIRVWGWDKPGQPISVAFAGREASTKTGEDGKWTVHLDPLKASSQPGQLSVTGSGTVQINDVLVGEVWLCSGQSNMQWPVASSDDSDLESLTARYPRIRLITVPQVGSQTPLEDFDGKWELCNPETVLSFSAVGYYFGRTLHQALDVPIGLIDNAWGGSAAEAWVRRDVLETDPRYRSYLDIWNAKEENLDADIEKWLASLKSWKSRAAKLRAEGKPVPRMQRSPVTEMRGQHRPGNLYNGCLNPIIGYTLRGVIWYQGESNVPRAYNYRFLFPLMITQWRQEWDQGDLPFYWVQLADFRDEQPQPANSEWAELQEAQTMTLRLQNTAQAVIYDLGEAHDIHPRDKQNVAKRLARHALAKDYGFSLVSESPRYKSHNIEGGKVLVTFDHVGGGMDTFDVRSPLGFAVAGADQEFVWAQAKIIDKDRIEVWSDQVSEPAAVRYAWADNPVANVQNKEGLPLTPFRTDDWNTVTKPES